MIQDEADRRVFGCCASDLDEDVDVNFDFEVYPDNLASLHAFVACEDRWLWMMVGNKAIRIGLDLPAVRLVLWGLNIVKPKQIFNDIRLMEHEALKAFGEES